MSFINSGTLNPHGAPVLRREILTNSVTFTVGDSVRFASGFIALGTAGSLVLGHINSIGTNQGVGLNTNGIAGSEIGSFVNSYLTASNNQTVAQVKADIDISKHTLYSAALDAAPGTTPGSNLAGNLFDLADEDELDESTVSATTGQYFSWGLDPLNSNRVVVNIVESLVFGA